MATVVNNPSTTDEGSGVGMVVGIILAILLIVLFFAYGLPALRSNNGGGSNINVTLPSGSTATPGASSGASAGGSASGAVSGSVSSPAY